MPIGVGGRTRSQAVNGQHAIGERVVSARSTGEKAKLGEQMAQGEGKPKRVILTEVYSRIVGYLRPVSSWNLSKAQEFKDRLVYNMPEAETTDAERASQED